MKTKTKAKVIIMAIMVLATILIVSTKTQANYQSVMPTRENGVEYLGSVSPKVWINNIRNMEADGEVMGLTETHDEGTLLSTSGSNNIDAHLMKNTEYGAIAILSASKEYGKQGEGSDRYVMDGAGLKTTTGNVYGMYPTRNYEWTASDFTGSASNGFGENINEKYRDMYTEKKETKPGDALLPWHGNSSVTWNYTSSPVYYRGRSSSLFSSYSRDASYSSSLNYGRACVVSGAGL